MIILCYDGSEDAQAAADHVIRLFHDRPVTVLTVLESYIQMLAAAGFGLGSGFGLGYQESDQTAAVIADLRNQAQRTAEDGTRRLRAAGVEADPLVQQRDRSVAATVLAVAERLDADAVVVGTRGRGAARSALLGSVSHELVQHADRAGRTGRRFSPGATPNPYTPPTMPEGKVNITDLDAKLVKGMRGWIQGYNAQAVCNDQHLIVAAEVMTASPDFGHLGPMLTAARRELANAGVTQNPDVVVADAGYWHLEQMNEITADGIPVLIPPDSSRRANKPKRPGWHGGAYDFMRSVLSTPLGAALYKQRAQLIEPIFGNTKHNRGFTRFHRRGRSAARTEWRLMAATHNLGKLHQHFLAATT
jgi:nucleotide-binding universal stress UspA family protein